PRPPLRIAACTALAHRVIAAANPTPPRTVSAPAPHNTAPRPITAARMSSPAVHRYWGWSYNRAKGRKCSPTIRQTTGGSSEAPPRVERPNTVPAIATIWTMLTPPTDRPHPSGRARRRSPAPFLPERWPNTATVTETTAATTRTTQAARPAIDDPAIAHTKPKTAKTYAPQRRSVRSSVRHSVVEVSRTPYVFPERNNRGPSLRSGTYFLRRAPILCFLHRKYVRKMGDETCPPVDQNDRKESPENGEANEKWLVGRTSPSDVRPTGSYNRAEDGNDRHGSRSCFTPGRWRCAVTGSGHSWGWSGAGPRA